jgi:glycosyltransferase involved in cell wall biosynthesis
MGDFPRHAGHGPRAAADGAPTRVLFVHTATRPPLGADTWIHAQIMANLDRSSHELHAACATGPPAAPTPTYDALRRIGDVNIQPVRFGVEHSSDAPVSHRQAALATVPALYDLVGLARFIRRNRIDIIHTSDRPRDAAAAVVLGRMTGAKSIVQAHVAYGAWMGPVLRWALRHADVRIAISSFVARTLDAAGHDLCRTYVVRNGIDTSQWTPGAGRQDARRELGIPADSPVVMTACRLFPSKGPAELIQAMAATRDRHPNARLLVVGREMVPGYAAELAGLATELGVADRVQLLGQRNDMGRLMAAADVFAMPSVGEPFGLVYAEAMAMELPVVALDSGGATEVVQHGTTGLLSAPGDRTALAANLSRLLSDPDRRHRMGVNGRRRVEADFTSERMADDVANVYRAVLGRQTAPVAERPFDRAAPAAGPTQERGNDAITVG